MEEEIDEDEGFMPDTAPPLHTGSYRRTRAAMPGRDSSGAGGARLRMQAAASADEAGGEADASSLLSDGEGTQSKVFPGALRKDRAGSAVSSIAPAPSVVRFAIQSPENSMPLMETTTRTSDRTEGGTVVISVMDPVPETNNDDLVQMNSPLDEDDEPSAGDQEAVRTSVASSSSPEQPHCLELGIRKPEIGQSKQKGSKSKSGRSRSVPVPAAATAVPEPMPPENMEGNTSSMSAASKRLAPQPIKFYDAVGSSDCSGPSSIPTHNISSSNLNYINNSNNSNKSGQRSQKKVSKGEGGRPGGLCPYGCKTGCLGKDVQYLVEGQQRLESMLSHVLETQRDLLEAELRKGPSTSAQTFAPQLSRHSVHSGSQSDLSKLIPASPASGLRFRHILREPSLDPDTHQRRSVVLEAARRVSRLINRSSRTSLNSDSGIVMNQESSSTWQNFALPVGWPGSIEPRFPSPAVSQQGSELKAFLAQCRRQKTRVLIAKSISRESLVQHKTETTIMEPDSPRLCCWGRFPLDPNAKPRMWIDLCSLAMLLYDLTSMPIILGWELPLEGWVLVGTMISMFFWSIDIFLNFATAIYRDGDVDYGWRDIAKHYIKTFFFMDLGVVSCDWVSVTLAIVGDSVFESSETFRVLRFTKISRLLRLVSVCRMLRVVDFLERQLERHNVTGTFKFLVDVLKLTGFIVWCNHLIGCLWVWIGRNGWSDTEARWFESATSSPNADTYADTTIMFQYFTAVHWSITQMTPGSMELSPKNSLERFFNILCLIFGLLFFSTLVSTLSAKMTHFRMKREERTKMLAQLRRFLRQSQVDPRLGVKLQRQVVERISASKPLIFTDIQALNLVSLALRSQLVFELCRPHLLTHSFFLVWEQVDKPIMQKVCMECMDFCVLAAGDNLFLTGHDAVGAYNTLTGKLQYEQEPKSSMVTQRHVQKIDPCVWLSEAALWCHWTHTGTVESLKTSQVLLIKAEHFVKQLNRSDNKVIRYFGSEYAKNFVHRVHSAKGPASANLPSDVRVPDTSFEELIWSLPGELRHFVGLVALEFLRKSTLGWAGRKASALEQEVGDGESVLILHGGGRGPDECKSIEVMRFVNLVVLNLGRADSKFIVQLGTIGEDGQTQPSCKLPALKIKEQEIPNDALDRMMKQYLDLYRDGLQILHNDKEETLDISERYSGIPCKYIRNIIYAQIDESKVDDDICFVEDPMAATICPCPDTPEVMVVNQGDKGVRLYAWVTDEQMDILKQQQAERDEWIKQLVVPKDIAANGRKQALNPVGSFIHGTETTFR